MSVFLLRMHLYPPSMTTLIDLTLRSNHRTIGDDDGQDGEEHDLFCRSLAGGFDELRCESTGHTVSQ